MSLLSKAEHNIADLLTGKATFAQVRDSEIADFKAAIGKLPTTAQAFVNGAVTSLETGLSALVGAGQSAIGPFLAESVDNQATDVLNLLSKLGVPTNGVLSAAEHAALAAVITGLKAGLDRVGIQIATNGTVTVEEEEETPAKLEPAAPVVTNAAASEPRPFGD